MKQTVKNFFARIDKVLVSGITALVSIFTAVLLWNFPPDHNVPMKIFIPVMLVFYLNSQEDSHFCKRDMNCAVELVVI